MNISVDVLKVRNNNGLLDMLQTQYYGQNFK